MRLNNTDRIVFLGDSITRGFVGSNFIDILKKQFNEQAGIQGIQIINSGENGNTIEDLLRRLDRDVLRCKPTWIVIMIGINDVFQDSYFSNPLLESTARPYSDFLHTFTEQYSSLTKTIVSNSIKNIILCTTTGIEGDVAVSIRERLALLNDRIRSIAQSNDYYLIDIYSAFRTARERLLSSRNANQFPYILTIDGVHLNNHGASVVAATLKEFLIVDS